MKNYLIIILLSLVSISCIPVEDPVQAYNRGDAIVAQVEMGELYTSQMYFSLDANQILKTNLMTDWDIAFADTEGRIDITLNYCTMAKVAKITNKTYDEIDLAFANTIADSNWQYDNSQGHLDSLAISDWYSIADSKIKDNAFILDRGIDDKGKQIGKFKFKITNFANNTYHLTYTDLKTNITNSVQITKTGKYNYQHLSLATGTILQLEPESKSWDLLFSKYTTLLYSNLGEPTWRGVTSVLINPFFDEVAIIQDTTFENIDNSIIPSLTFTKNRDAIGHDWKTYQFNSASYIVNDKKIFIIKSASGFYYKFHFIDFYSNAGIKGSPKFEFKKL